MQRSSKAMREAISSQDATAPEKEMIATIENEISKWHSRRPKLEADLAAARNEVARAKEKRDLLLLPSLDNDDAKRQLDERQADFVIAEQEVEQLMAMMEQVDKKLAGLNADLGVAKREHALAQLRVFARQRLEIAKELDKLLAPLPALLQRWRTAATNCSSLASSAGLRETGHAFYRPDTLAAAIAWKLFGLFPQGVRPSQAAGGMGDQLRQPFAVIERQALARVLGPVPVESKPKTVEYVSLFAFGITDVTINSPRRITVTFDADDSREMVDGGYWQFIDAFELVEG